VRLTVLRIAATPSPWKGFFGEVFGVSYFADRARLAGGVRPAITQRVLRLIDRATLPRPLKGAVTLVNPGFQSDLSPGGWV
jgi:hypothetical protein